MPTTRLFAFGARKYKPIPDSYLSSSADRFKAILFLLADSVLQSVGDDTQAEENTDNQAIQHRHVHHEESLESAPSSGLANEPQRLHFYNFPQFAPTKGTFP